MKVLLACALKFHSDHVGYQLQRNGSLYRLITSVPPFAYKREPIDKKKIVFLPPAFLFSWVLSKLLARFYFFRSLVEWLVSAYFDWTASFFIGSPDISLSWAWSSYYIIKKVQHKGGIAIVEESGSFNKYQQKILKQEYERLGLKYRSDIHQGILEREQRECEAADYILCPSKYTANSLIEYGIKKGKIIIIPYGVDISTFRKESRKDDVFRVFYLGGIRVRKGLIYLFRALEGLKLSNFECLIIGKVEDDFKPFFNQYKRYFKHISEYIPLNRMRCYYSNASVFVLPSIDDAFGLVVLEAMACGLPVICTTNTGAAELIRDNMEGFVVPIRDSNAIKEKIEYLYHNPVECERMGNNALQRAKDCTWDNYGKAITRELKQIMSNRYSR